MTASDPPAGATVTRSPAQVRARFSEELDTKGSTMHVLDAAGSPVSQGDGKVDLDDPDYQVMLATLPAVLPEGVYTVQWHAGLTDGDASDGAFKFAVQPQGTPLLPTIAATGTAAEVSASAPTEVAPASQANAPASTLPTRSVGAWPLAIVPEAAGALGIVIWLRRNGH